MRSSRPAPSLVSLVLCSGLASGCGGAGTGVMSLHDTSPDRTEFFALPWPSDSRVSVDAGGHPRLDLGGFHDPGSVVSLYLSTFQQDDFTGFGASSSTYFRFDGPLDSSSLPADAVASVDAGASAFFLDITPGSPTFGRRHPMRARFAAESGSFIGPNWLAMLPEPGFPLRERTTYAAVITDAVRGENGAPVRRDPRFVFPEITLPAAIDREHVVNLTVFTVGEFTHVMKELREAIYDEQPAGPTLGDLRWASNDKYGRYVEYTGSYDAPNYQEGEPPYLKSGGRIHRGPDGKPHYVRMETLRVAMTIPTGQMPAGGWPVVLYAHGTGGDYETFIDDRSAGAVSRVQDDDDSVIAKMAMISIDQVLHGPRDPTGGDPEITFYNFQNLWSARDSIKQGGADDFSLLRLVEKMDIPAAPKTGVPIKFDRDRIYFKGHSQGGSTGPLFLAFEPNVKAAVLSGAGAGLILALLNKTEPIDIPAIVGAIVNEDVDEFHPFLNLLQMFLDSSDPGNYGRYFFRETPDGQAPKSIFQSLGIVDHYTPIPTIKALALSMAVQPAGASPEPIDALPLDGIDWAAPPLSENVARGGATGVMVEYKVPIRPNGTQQYDGHFVVFDNPDAVRQSNRFLATHALTGIAHLVP